MCDLEVGQPSVVLLQYVRMSIYPGNPGINPGCPLATTRVITPALESPSTEGRPRSLRALGGAPTQAFEKSKRLDTPHVGHRPVGQSQQWQRAQTQQDIVQNGVIIG